ncbi:hypothetical protein VQ7734_02314 [Vibrio quintilis]|uniref:Uncharacterized protein n=1 Tax=Vibrio quintilis TaxID=1117707 RepID=A0A1M7YVB1_9VIBR|nr:hypothetical protein VQ7734_02314 [Vibrio quintilis]
MGGQNLREACWQPDGDSGFKTAFIRDRVFFCIPAPDINLSITAGNSAAKRSRLSMTADCITSSDSYHHAWEEGMGTV